MTSRPLAAMAVLANVLGQLRLSASLHSEDGRHRHCHVFAAGGGWAWRLACAIDEPGCGYALAYPERGVGPSMRELPKQWLQQGVERGDPNCRRCGMRESCCSTISTVAPVTMPTRPVRTSTGSSAPMSKIFTNSRLWCRDNLHISLWCHDGQMHKCI